MAYHEKVIPVKRNCPFCSSTQVKYCEDSAMDGYPEQFIQCCGCGITIHVENEVAGMIFWHYGLEEYQKYIDSRKIQKGACSKPTANGGLSLAKAEVDV